MRRTSEVEAVLFPLAEGAFLRCADVPDPAPDESDDGHVLSRWLMRRRAVGAGTVISQPGASDPFVHFVQSGWSWAFRTAAGGRQITAILLPGDFCGLTMAAGLTGSSGFSTITTCEIASIPRGEVLDAIEQQPSLASRLWKTAARLEVIREERMLSLGRRIALSRMAHLICEIAHRLGHPMSGAEHWLPLPLTQAELADVLGMSTVHVNRVLQALRGEGQVEHRQGRLKVGDWQRLRDLAGFDESYLA